SAGLTGTRGGPSAVITVSSVAVALGWGGPGVAASARSGAGFPAGGRDTIRDGAGLSLAGERTAGWAASAVRVAGIFPARRLSLIPLTFFVDFATTLSSRRFDRLRPRATLACRARRR